MVHTYSYLFKIPTTGVRFFTVYGPWRRPDMALFIFVSKILKGESIPIFNRGQMERDFTYIDDVVEALSRLLDLPPRANVAWRGRPPDPASSPAPYKLYNISSSHPVSLMAFVEAIEKELGKKAKKQLVELQPGDVLRHLRRGTRFVPPH